MQSCFSSSSEYKIDSGICKCFSSNCQAKVYDNVEGEENNEICPKWLPWPRISLQKISHGYQPLCQIKLVLTGQDKLDTGGA